MTHEHECRRVADPDAHTDTRITEEINPELTEPVTREGLLSKLKGFAGQIATAMGRAEVQRPLD